MYMQSGLGWFIYLNENIYIYIFTITRTYIVYENFINIRAYLILRRQMEVNYCSDNLKKENYNSTDYVLFG